MNEKLRIPKRIKVGFQKRDDTYTGKLAYVIEGGRKKDPTSWSSWRAKNIAPEEFDNVPTEGFVLNREVGGTRHSYGWDARLEKIRVYDPRGFEFELMIENVLLILQECSSIKGKGLEGQFVLAWSGTHIVLLPICSQEYKTAVEFIELGEKKVSKDDIQEGCTYLTKDKVNVMYLGRHAWFDEIPPYWYGSKLKRGQKMHVFLNLDEANQKKSRKQDCYLVEGGFTKLAKKTCETPVPQFAEEYEKLLASPFVSVPKELVVKKAKLKDWDSYGYHQGVGIVDGDKVWFGRVQITPESYSYYDREKPKKFTITCQHQISIRNGELEKKDCGVGNVYRKDKLTPEEVAQLAKDVYIKCENGSEYLYA